MNKGVLLINLGSPDAPTTPAVRRYLREFLSDPWVIDIPVFFRMCLLYALILPFRSPKTAKAYQAIWTQQGSPLVHTGQQLAAALQHRLGAGYHVALGMRYGNPSIAFAVQQLKAAQCQHCVVVPLFPQFSMAATGSALELAKKVLAKYLPDATCHWITEFYQDPGFIQSWVHNIQTCFHKNPHWEQLLISYHGLPVRQLKKIGCSVCPGKQPCPRQLTEQERRCYRAQCYQTSRLIAQGLHLSEHQYQTSFQSRLGGAAWIQPYTDQVLIDLADQGIKHVVVACPAFVADCLETLEEIGMRAQEQWQELGGASLTLVPCLNADDHWAQALSVLINHTLG